MKRVPRSNLLPFAALAVAAVVAMTGFVVYTFSNSQPQPPHSTSPLLSLDTPGEKPGSNVWLWSAVAALGVAVIFTYFRHSNRRAYAKNGTIAALAPQQPLRTQAADQLRDALAVFNRPIFDEAETGDDLVPLYKAFVSARVESKRRNSRFMYDAVGASQIQVVERMLTEMEEDLSRQWPKVHKALQRMPDSPAETDSERFRTETGGEYDAVAAYLHLLREDVHKELVHAELRYRRLLG